MSIEPHSPETRARAIALLLVPASRRPSAYQVAAAVGVAERTIRRWARQEGIDLVGRGGRPRKTTDGGEKK